jgi:hypothetical protein
MSMESHGGIMLAGGNLRTRRKSCPSSTSSITNPTWIDLSANTGLRGERPATNCLVMVGLFRLRSSRENVEICLNEV